MATLSMLPQICASQLARRENSVQLSMPTSQKRMRLIVIINGYAATNFMLNFYAIGGNTVSSGLHTAKLQ